MGALTLFALLKASAPALNIITREFALRALRADHNCFSVFQV